jgi:hypothetical protein
VPEQRVEEAARALRLHHTRQVAQRLRAVEAWQDNDLVFCTRTGTELAAGNIRRAFRSIGAVAMNTIFTTTKRARPVPCGR